MRCRAPALAKLESHFGEHKKKVLKVIEESEMVVAQGCRAIERSKWEARPENAGKNLVTEGHKVEWILVDGRGMVECVMLAKLAEGEYDVSFNNKRRISLEEEPAPQA